MVKEVEKFWKKEGIRVLRGILSKLIQDRFEMIFYVEPMFV
jgi:hypothetical protein